MRSSTFARIAGLALLGAAVHVGAVRGQQAASVDTSKWTTAEDHQNMMAQLGIRKLRPGPSGNAGAPNQANYNEATANPYPNLPEVLTLKSGRKVATADAWWKQRRPEIAEEFDREVLGRVPRNAPKVTWTVTTIGRANIGGHDVVGKQLVGHVDNSAYPALNVDIQMTLVTPANAKGAVRVLLNGQALPTANVLYSGITPSSPGLYQLNITIPDTTPDGDLPFIIEIGGVQSSVNAFLAVKR